MSFLHLPTRIGMLPVMLMRTIKCKSLAGEITNLNALRQRNYCSRLTKSKTQDSGKEVGMPLGERIKENTKTASYTGVILLGIGLTGGLFYVIFRELFSSNSPNNIYTAALDRCVNDPQVQDALGAPIKGFGEENSRRRRRHVAHTLYELDGVRYIRMNFYIQGLRNKATVFLEKKTNESGNFDHYRYLFVQLDYYPKTTIVLEDNRNIQNTPSL